ncbi:hypothetical protein CFT12S00416_05585 [Campylobacter fetus subsp. testudinum]|uniref:helix-turn-helix domain-containing protein n=1 Tax=Campylobacter fetus TaxID=196 RepID=UPI00081892C8|nr:helix-turn-helix domain-containing protein [Campylobacter fetus]OCR88896.1 hypothetical protein CFT12S00416_05585 [Campylobacter fetus subsp. testudinum]
MENIDKILGRLRYHFGVKTDVELANSLKIPYKTLTAWKTRKAIPEKRLAIISKNENLDLNWLQNGDGFGSFQAFQRERIEERFSAKGIIKNLKLRFDLDDDDLCNKINISRDRLNLWIEKNEIPIQALLNIAAAFNENHERLFGINLFYEPGEKNHDLQRENIKDIDFIDIGYVKEYIFHGENVERVSTFKPEIAAQELLDGYGIEYINLLSCKFMKDDKMDNLRFFVKIEVNFK